MRSEFPKGAAKVLPSDRSRRDADNLLLIGLPKVFGQFLEIARVRDGFRDARVTLRRRHLAGIGNAIANPVRAFMTKTFEPKAEMIGWRFAR